MGRGLSEALNSSPKSRGSRLSVLPDTPFHLEAGGPPLTRCARLYGAGEARCRADTLIAPPEKRYAAAAIGVVISGIFDYQAQTGGGLAGPGAIIFGNAGEAFSCRHLDAEGNRRAVVALSAEVVAEVAHDCGLDEVGFGLAVLAPSRRGAVLYGAIRRAVAAGLADDEVVTLVACALRMARDFDPTPLAPAERARVLGVARFLDSAYDEPLSLDDMAAAAGLSRYHFVRVFRSVVGDSPHQYLIGVRLRAAANRLLDSREPITAIALDVGFNDISHFNATFRRAFGVAPGTWRKAA